MCLFVLLGLGLLTQEASTTRANPLDSWCLSVKRLLQAERKSGSEMARPMHPRSPMQPMHEPPTSLDLTRPFLPEALAGLSSLQGTPLDDEDDLRALNQIRAGSYLHVFDMLETSLSDAARVHASRDEDAKETLGPLLHLHSFDHNELFRGFERIFAATFSVPPMLAPRPADLDEILVDAAPLSLLILALHLKLVTQQHYLACVRGDESLEPVFVRVLKDHWAMECGRTKSASSALAIQQALGGALPGRVPAALRDYRRIIFVVDDVLRRQSELDVRTLEEARGKRFGASDHATIALAQLAAHRKTFITFGIVNAAFVYAMRSLGPTAPSVLAGVVSALSRQDPSP